MAGYWVYLKLQSLPSFAECHLYARSGFAGPDTIRQFDRAFAEQRMAKSRNTWFALAMRQALDPSLLEEAMKENEDSDSGNVHEKKKRKLGLCDDVKRKQNKQDEEENTAKDQKKEEHMKVRERACAARTPMQELTKKTGDTPIIAAKTNIEQREG